jgi:hypothetical protein
MIKLIEKANLFENSNKKKITAIVIGQEKDGVFLVAIDDNYQYQTSIELIDIINNERKILYVDENLIKIVSASINYERTILSYTTFRKKSENDEEGKYESFLVEIESKKSNNRFLFNLKGML